jgi:hypothetical protein
MTASAIARLVMTQTPFTDPLPAFSLNQDGGAGAAALEPRKIHLGEAQDALINAALGSSRNDSGARAAGFLRRHRSQ